MRFSVILLIYLIATLNNIKSQDTLQTVATTYQNNADQIAKNAVAKILQYTGLTPHFVIVENKSIKSAIAYIKNNRYFIAYNPDFILKLKDLTHTDWAAMSVLAHEIGHHFNGHTLQKKVSLTDELEADKYSGFILRLMGATLPETKAALTAVAHEVDTIKHPKPELRLQAIANGWYEAGMLLQKNALYKDTKTVGNNLTKFKFTVRLKGDNQIYFIDEANQVIWFDNFGKPIKIGILEKSENSKYLYVIEINKIVYGVDKNMQIWNANNSNLVFTIGIMEPYSNE